MALPTSPTTSAGGGVVAAAAAFVAGGLSAYLFFKQWPTRGAAAQPRAHRPSPTPTFSGEPLLAGRVVVVTGGSSGIGREIALLCAAHGARVIVFDLTPDPLEGGLPTAVEAAKRRAGTVGGDKLNTGHGEVLFLQGDTAAEGGCARAVDEAVERWGRLDVWVNNAAIGQGGTLLETSAESWDKVLGVNARGYFLGCKVRTAWSSQWPVLPRVCAIGERSAWLPATCKQRASIDTRTARSVAGGSDAVSAPTHNRSCGAAGPADQHLVAARDGRMPRGHCVWCRESSGSVHDSADRSGLCERRNCVQRSRSRQNFVSPPPPPRVVVFAHSS